MKFPFNRTAHARGWVGAAQLLGHVLATGGGLAVYFGLRGFDLQRIWDEDLEGKHFMKESLFDVVLVNCIRTAVFIFLWTFTVGWHMSVLVVALAAGYLVCKLCLAGGLLVHGFGLVEALLTLLSILLDVAALCSFRTAYSDPDVELLLRAGGRAAAGGARQPRIELSTVLLQDGQGAAASRGAEADDAPHGKASVLRTLLRFTSPDVGLLAVGTVLMLLSMGSQLLLPGFTGRCLSAALSGEEGRASFNENLFGLVLTSIMLAFFTATRIWNTAKLEVRLICRVQRILFACILERDVSYFDTIGTGQLTSRISSDAQLLAQIMTTNMNLVLQKGIILFGALAFMFTLNWSLAGVYVVVSLSFFAFTRWFGQLTKRLQKGIQSVRADANQVAMQALSGIRTVRACTAEPFEREHYDAESRRLVTEELRLKMCWTCYAPLVAAITNVLTIVVLVLGGHFVAAGELSPGDLAAFLFYSQMVQDAMNTVASQIVAVFQGLGAGEKIFEIIAAPPPKVPLEGGLALNNEELAAVPATTPLLEFRAVSFRFPGKTSDTLRALALTVHFEESVGIVGPSGSGKSTLLTLALRFFDPTEGGVFFAGWDARALDPRWLRRQVANVPQDPMLFDTSIRKNVAYARPEAEEEEILSALRRAEATAFVEALPEGLESRVGERGVTLSGGQRQRLALARALLLRPRLLALDEATSALDTATEALVNENILALHAQQRKAGHGFAMMVIAHRLSTVRDLDAIWVVHDGAAKEKGTHQALLSARGAYYELVQKQLLAERAASDEEQSQEGGSLK